jgi:hypothetical protein
MLMPKTTLYKNAGSKSGQYNIRLAWQICAMKAKTIAMRVQKFSDGKLRLGVLAFNSAHHAGSCSSVDDVHFVISQSSVVS